MAVIWEPGTAMALHAFGDLVALEELGGLPEVGEAAVGAGADEGDIDLDALDGGAAGELHVIEGLLEGLGLGLAAGLGGIGDGPSPMPMP